MKRIIRETWRHFVVAFILQMVINNLSFFKDELLIGGQLLLAAVAWFLINLGFEIYQKGKGGTNTRKQLFEDCLSASAGAVTSVLIFNLF